MTQEERLEFLLKKLLVESYADKKIKLPESIDERKSLLRGLMNIRIPTQNIENEILKVQDEYLKEEIKIKGITELGNLNPVQDDIYIWQGDITTLKVDGIVNAANSKMLGCFVPNHLCIDNAIHTFAGMQLRLECNEIMKKQGFDEPTGKAKITKAYNLPCKYILHTVGPIIYEELTSEDCKLLENCYISCLETAVENGLKSVAFCCISTGEFHFPNDRAAEIAINTVKKFKRENDSDIKIIFNVFKDLDLKIYTDLLK